MSLFIREYPLTTRNNKRSINSLFNDFENEFFNHPLMSFPSLYPFHYRHPTETLEKQISKVFDDSVFIPKINLSEDENNYYIHADLPGMTKDQIKMEFSEEDHSLTLSGERKSVIDDSNDKENKDETKDNKNVESKPEETKEETKKETKKENEKKYTRIECSYGKFERSFSIPENADVNKIEAKMENGVLEVKISKMEPPKHEKRSIQIM